MNIQDSPRQIALDEEGKKQLSGLKNKYNEMIAAMQVTEPSVAPQEPLAPVNDTPVVEPSTEEVVTEANMFDAPAAPAPEEPVVPAEEIGGQENIFNQMDTPAPEAIEGQANIFDQMPTNEVVNEEPTNAEIIASENIFDAPAEPAPEEVAAPAEEIGGQENIFNQMDTPAPEAIEGQTNMFDQEPASEVTPIVEAESQEEVEEVDLETRLSDIERKIDELSLKLIVDVEELNNLREEEKYVISELNKKNSKANDLGMAMHM